MEMIVMILYLDTILNLDTKAFIYYEEGIYKADERRSQD